MQEFQKEVKSSQKLDSIADMKVCSGLSLKLSVFQLFNHNL